MLLGSPIWNVRAPMIMSTFAESFDFTGKTVFPFTTYVMSRLGTTVRDYSTACRSATIGASLAVRGEEVRNADGSSLCVAATHQPVNVLKRSSTRDAETLRDKDGRNVKSSSLQGDGAVAHHT